MYTHTHTAPHLTCLPAHRSLFLSHSFFQNKMTTHACEAGRASRPDVAPRASSRRRQSRRRRRLEQHHQRRETTQRVRRRFNRRQLGVLTRGPARHAPHARDARSRLRLSVSAREARAAAPGAAGGGAARAGQRVLRRPPAPSRRGVPAAVALAGADLGVVSARAQAVGDVDNRRVRGSSRSSRWGRCWGGW